MKKITLLLCVLAFAGISGMKAQTYFENFESLAKVSYAAATVTLNGYEWNFTGSNAGNGASDWKIDTKSARLCGVTKTTSNAETSKIEMLANKPGGIGNITFQYRKYGTDDQIPWSVEWSANGTTWTAISQITATDEVQSFTYALNQANARIRVIAVGFTTGDANGKRMNIDNLTLTDNGGAVASAAPAISPASGNIYGPINVTITSASTGAAIYYTLDNSTPDNTKTPYSAPFTVSATTTVKAIAYEKGKDPSPVTIANYTLAKIITVSNIAGLRAVSLPSTEVYKLTSKAVLTLKTASRNAKYIQDASGAILIDDPTGKITTVYNLGDGITDVVGTLGSYNGMLQFTPIENTPPPYSTGNIVTPKVITLAEMVKHQAELVTINSLTINDLATGGNGTFLAGKNYPIAGTTTEVLRTAYSDLDYIGAALPTEPKNITGVVLTYSPSTGTPSQQLVPRCLTDIIATGLQSVKMHELAAWTSNGKIHFNAVVGDKVEVYNTLGQRLYNAPAAEGQNEVAISTKGVTIIKVGNRVGKVIL